ncbi:MAG: arylsulfatase [Bacteroidales bacterium]|nr:arylsulfatase [Bacteroidales bacterium]
MKNITILLILAFVIISTRGYAQETDPPNIVVILADDMGFSDLGCYGSEIHTPNIDELAQQGLRFTQFYNAGRCWPTRSSIMTGYYPQQTNNDGKRGAFPHWAHLLPHHLKQAGYRNYHSGKWHVPNVKKIIEEGGFDRSYHTGAYDNHFAASNHFLNDEPLPPAKESDGYYSTTAITNYALDFLEEHHKKHNKDPFFLYLAYITPHFPVQAPEEDIAKYMGKYDEGWEVLKHQRYARQQELGFSLGENSPFEYMVTAPWSWPDQWLRDSIDGEMRLARPWEQLTKQEKFLQARKMAIHAAMVDRIDQETGRLMDKLEQMGVGDNTLILFLSDNGASAEQIIRGEGHDPDAPLGSGASYLCLGPGFSTACNTPFRRHKHWTHEGGIATPLIASWPYGIKSRGEFRNSMGHVIDLLPTFLELAGVEPVKENNGYSAPELPGQSLVPVFSGDQKIHEELYFSHEGNNALRSGKWKAVISRNIDGRWQLYNMEEDRTELNNLADNFFRFGDDAWKQSMQQRLTSMKERWETLDKLYQQQGKAGFESTARIP